MGSTVRYVLVLYSSTRTFCLCLERNSWPLMLVLRQEMWYGLMFVRFFFLKRICIPLQTRPTSLVYLLQWNPVRPVNHDVHCTCCRLLRLGFTLRNDFFQVPNNCGELKATHASVSSNAIPDNSPQMVMYGNKAKRVLHSWSEQVFV